MYSVEEGVLDKLEYLAGNVGDSLSARKFGVKEPRALNTQETEWIKEALKKLIRRAGEYAAVPQKQRQQITMAVLPPL